MINSMMDNEVKIVGGQKHYYEEVDILKGIAIALVILGHSIILYPINLHEISWCLNLFNCVSTAHMPLLFLISGFCFSFKGNYKPYLWGKIKRIAIPYFIFNAADMFPRYFLSFLVNRSRGLGESLVQTLLYGGEYWFLYTLMIIFLVFPIISVIETKFQILTYPILIALLLVKFIPNFPSTFMLNYVACYIFFFYLGYVCKKELPKLSAFKQIIINHKSYWWLAEAVGLVIWIALIMMNSNCNMVILAIINALIGIIFFFVLVELVNSKALKTPFIEFGKYSLQLYLLNGFLQVASRTFIVSIFGITNAAVIIVFNMLIDIVLSYFIIKYIFKRFKLLRVISGIV